MERLPAHQLVMVSAYLSGAQEFLCPSCGFRLLRTRLPDEQFIVLIPGNDPSAHQDFSGPLSASQSSALPPPLAPWLDWIHKIDFDDLHD